MRVVLLILLAVVVLLCAGIVGVGCLVGGAATTAAATATPGRTVVASTAAAESFDRKIATAIPAGRGTVILTEAEVTSKINEVLATTAGAPQVTNLQVQLDPGVIQGEGRVGTAFGNQRVVMRLALDVTDGQLTGRLERLTVGGFALPQALQNQILVAALAALGVQVPPGTDLTDLSNIRMPSDLRTLKVRQGDILIELGR
jgi:hypothetical protein